MSNARANEVVRKLTRNGGLIDYGAHNLHLLGHVVRALAQSRLVTGERADQGVAELGTGRDEAEQFLRKVTERDDDNIVGALGLSLTQHPHRFTVKGVQS